MWGWHAAEANLDAPHADTETAGRLTSRGCSYVTGKQVPPVRSGIHLRFENQQTITLSIPREIVCFCVKLFHFPGEST